MISGDEKTGDEAGQDENRREKMIRGKRNEVE